MYQHNFDFSTLVCGSTMPWSDINRWPCLPPTSRGTSTRSQWESPISPLKNQLIESNHLRINYFGNHCNPQAAPSQVTLYPVRNISRCALAKSDKLIEVSSCLSKYRLVYRSIFLFIEVSSCWQRWGGGGPPGHGGLAAQGAQVGRFFTFDLGDSSQLF